PPSASSPARTADRNAGKRRPFAMTSDEARALYTSLVTPPDAPVDLERAALAIAAEDDPAVDVDASLAALDALADRVREGLPEHPALARTLVRLRDVLFHELGFDGARCDFEDPASSFLHEVLARRTGLPILLAMVF